MTCSLRDAYGTLDFCADCKKCEEFCPVGIPTGELLLKIKETQGPRLWEKALSSLFRSKALAEKGAGIMAVLQKAWQKEGYFRRLPLAWAREKRIPVLKPQKTGREEAPGGPKAYLFQGCLVKYFFPEVRESVVKSLVYFGYHVVTPPDQVCCGAPSYHLGDTKAVRTLVRKNLESFAKEEPDVIITICPTGHAFLKNLYPRLDPRASRFAGRIQDFTAFIALKGHLPPAKAADKQEVYYHYPCHSLTELKLGDKPPELLRALGFKLAAQREPPACCGFCGVFSVRNPRISSHLWKNKKKEIMASGAPLVATDCPGCLFQLRSGLKTEDRPVRSHHTAEIFAGLLEQAGPIQMTDSRPGRECQGKD
jgi:Fe-S oxidoreductase